MSTVAVCKQGHKIAQRTVEEKHVSFVESGALQ